jgi:hypothetical protein
MHLLAMRAEGDGGAEQFGYGWNMVLAFLPPVLAVIVLLLALALWVRPSRRAEPTQEGHEAHEAQEMREMREAQDRMRSSCAGCLIWLAFGIGACYAWCAASIRN